MPTKNQPLAVAMMPLEARHEAILHLATKADALGYEAILLPETWSYNTTTLLAEIATRTSSLRVGTGILSVWGRSAATIAMAGATLNIMSGGRFILGLGSSTPQLVEGLHDVPYRAPYSKLRQTITQVRALAEGDRIPLAVASEARPLRLNLPACPPLPIYLAASSPKSIRLAGELCDGWIPFLYPRDRLADGITLLEQGASRSGDPARERQVYPIIPTIVAPDHATARAGAAWVVAFYLTTMGPIYRNVLSRYGYETAVESIMEANAGRKPSIVPPEGEVLLEQLTIYGTPQEARDKVAPWYAAGASLPTLMTNPNLSLDAISYVLDAFRPA
jgi:alkanesulfonate monooxygenase SsuD/methylene tetrahydromethanopterin reductase-like flavin-dependent oxidoreductase (luciferase family)